MLSDTIPPNSARQLQDWRVMEALLPGGIRTRHVCGQNADRSIGISTSAIQEFDRDAMTIRTRSGKIYTLTGKPGNCRLGSAAWDKWCNDNGTIGELDVTADFTDLIPETTITFKRLGVTAAG
jgi:hypothetical protein